MHTDVHCALTVQDERQQLETDLAVLQQSKADVDSRATALKADLDKERADHATTRRRLSALEMSATDEVKTQQVGRCTTTAEYTNRSSLNETENFIEVDAVL
jgi:hypothetical protein